MQTSRAPKCVALFATVPAMAALFVPLASAASPQLRLVALTGQAAPGTPAGTNFRFFGSAMFDGAPAIGADSTVGFAGILSDGTMGFWLDHGSGPELLARSGAHAPGTEPGVVFSQRSSEVILVTPPLLTPGHAVLRDTLSGPGVGFNNDEGFWNSTGSGLALLTREGAPAPGIAGAQISSMNLIALDDAGGVIFSTLLTGAATSDNNESIWRVTPNTGLELLAREGNAAPGAGVGVVFATPSVPSAFPIILGNSRADLLFQGNLQGPGTNDHNDEALFIRDASGTRLFIREGDAVPGMPGFVFREGSTAGFRSGGISLGDNHHVAIATSVAGAESTISALLSDLTGPLSVLVRSGDPAPGTTGHFDLLVNPIMNIHGDIAFMASTTPGSMFPPLGLWINSPTGLRVVALPGRPLSAQPNAAIVQSIRSINGFHDGGSLLFTADLMAPGGQFSTALLVADPSGDISIVARTGATIEVASGDSRTVSQIIVRLDSLSADAHAAFAVNFTDGSSAEFIAALAGTPSCFANCDNSTLAPILNVNDFTCFLNKFAAGNPDANCDASTIAPVLNVNDFTCFLNKFAAGCP